MLLGVCTACGAEKNVMEKSKKQGNEKTTDTGKQKQSKHAEKKKPAASSLKLTNTYTTTFAQVNAITYPNFQFAFPDHWKLSAKEVNQKGERVVLTNPRGVTITFSHISGVQEGELGGGSTTDMERVDITRVQKAHFTPGYVQGTDYAHLGNFMVAKVKVTGHIAMRKDSEFSAVDGAVAYVVLPETMAGTREDVRHPFETEFSFWYSDIISMVAEAPKGRFTTAEEKEVLAILASFQTEG